MTPPIISVIVAVYNRQKYIRQAVDSVLAQSFRDYELVVVDDGSTDGTPEILKEYRDKILVIRRERNSGLPSVARNIGMRHAKGRYIALLDSDDYWYPTKLEKQVDWMEADPNIALSHTFCRVVDEASNTSYIRREKEMPTEGDLFGRLIRECFITTSTVMIRNDVFARTSGFDENPRLRCGEDHVFFLRAAHEGIIGFIPEVLTAHRKCSDNISGEGFEFQQSILRTQQWILDHELLWRDHVTRVVPLRAFIETCIEFSFYWQLRGDYRKNRYFAAKAWRKAPCDLALGMHFMKGWVRGIMQKIGGRKGVINDAG